MFVKGLSAFLFSFLAVNAYAKDMQTTRSDGSKVNYYIDEPGSGNYPLLIVLQDDDCASVKAYHDSVAARLTTYVGAAVVTVDVRGLAPGASNCTEAYKQQNSINARIEDYRTVIAALKKTVTRWDKRFAFAGIGEGGTIAPYLASENPETVALGVMAASGGLTRTEELRLLQKHQGEYCGILTAGKLDMQINEMLRDAVTSKTWCSPHQTYKWWASALRLNPMAKMLELDIPIYVAHGTADGSRPIESADASVEKLKTSGNNVTYDRYEGYDHRFSQGGQSHMQSVMLKGIAWMRDVFNEGRFVGGENLDGEFSFNLNN